MENILTKIENKIISIKKILVNPSSIKKILVNPSSIKKIQYKNIPVTQRLAGLIQPSSINQPISTIQQSFNCLKCKKQFKIKQSLNQHYKNKHPISHTSNLQPQKVNINSHTKKTDKKCVLCDTILKNNDDFPSHLVQKHFVKYLLNKNTYIYKCKICDNMFSIQNVIPHIMNKHIKSSIKKSVKSPIINKSVKSPINKSVKSPINESLEKLDIGKDIKQQTCNRCEKTFIGTFRSHLEKYHKHCGNPKCYKILNNPSNIKIHRNRCTNESIINPINPTPTTYKSTKNKPKRRIENLKIYTLNEKKEGYKSFNNKYNPIYIESPSYCKICNKTFISEGNYLTHIKTKLHKSESRKNKFNPTYEKELVPFNFST